MNLNEVKEKYSILLKSIKLCKDNNFVEPVLIILYSAIDSLAWLNSKEKDIQKRNAKNEFKEFSNKYIISKLTQNITADELYAARCAVLHTISSRSINNIKKGIRYLTYANSPHAEIEGNDIIKSENENAVCINIFNLLCALVYAITDFFDDISKDNNKKKIVIYKAEEYYTVF